MQKAHPRRDEPIHRVYVVAPLPCRYRACIVQVMNIHYLLRFTYLLELGYRVVADTSADTLAV